MPTENNQRVAAEIHAIEPLIFNRTTLGNRGSAELAVEILRALHELPAPTPTEDYRAGYSAGWAKAMQQVRDYTILHAR